MFIIKLKVTWPDGTVEEDEASGNTRRTAEAAAAALTRQYELDDCTVERV